MHPKFNPRKLSVLNFAKTQASLEGVEPLVQFDRLHEFQQAHAEGSDVHFQANGEMRATSAGASSPWLVLSASVRLTLVCQRCLGPVEEEIAFEREFRFVEAEQARQHGIGIGAERWRRAFVGDRRGRQPERAGHAGRMAGRMR